ncbi:MAG: TolC family protein [Ekhidna sp.]|nr:TolC family protein [Ekhidna sp.]MBC6424936.1 TolC family protein [Ekhidna sp.]
MRRLLTILLSVFWLTGTAQESIGMSLDDCIKYAIEHNEQLEIARLENDISETQIKETLAGGFPEIDGSIEGTRNFSIQVTPIPDFISPSVYQVLVDENLVNDEQREFGTFPAAFGTDWNGKAGLSVSQLIFDGSFFVGLQAARTVKELSKKKEIQEKVDVIENVSKAYYLVLVSVKNLEFVARNFATVDTLYNETSALYENGFAEKIDVSRLKIQHNNLKVSLKNNTELLITSYNLLKFQMGMPLSERITLTDELTDELISSVQTDQEGDYTIRPEYGVLQTNKNLIALNIKNFRSQYIPNLYADYKFGWNSGTDTFAELTDFNDQWFKYSNLGLTLSIPIFDGFAKRANIQRNKIQMDQIQLNIDQFENNANREVIEARIKLENAKRSIEAQKENVALAQEVYNVTRIKYQEGVGSNFEVVETNTDLKESQTNYLNAVYEGITSQIELKKALGILNK